MKAIQFIDRPVHIPRSFYDEAVDHLIRNCSMLPGLLSIYRFGTVNSPGISDLDILFVFEEGAYCPMNGLESLPDKFGPLFTHGIMAMSENAFEDNFRFSIWSKADCIWGKQLTCPEEKSEQDQLILDRQTAVEFLMANYIDFMVQSSYGVFKLRSFLQHMKGLAYDMDLLNMSDSPLHPLISTLRELTIHWFEKTPADELIREWIESFSAVFPIVVDEILQKHPLMLPDSEGANYTIASNMLLTPGEKVGFSHDGWQLPVAFSFLGKSYFKLLHRTNRFLFTCPVYHQQRGFLADRFQFLQRMKAYNREHLPRFMTMTPSINAKLI